jgi:allophanate hydrolase subunit 2
MGGSFVVEGGPVRIALAGAVADLKVDGELVRPLASATAEPGQTITVGAARAGTFMVLAVSGGLDLPEDLGSQSFHLRAGLGGVARQPVESGAGARREGRADGSGSDRDGRAACPCRAVPGGSGTPWTTISPLPASRH